MGKRRRGGKGEGGREEGEGKRGEGKGEKRQNGGKEQDQQHIIERCHWLQVEIQNYLSSQSLRVPTCTKQCTHRYPPSAYSDAMGLRAVGTGNPSCV